MIHFSEYLNLILQHFETRGGILANINNFKGVLGIVFDTATSIDVAGVTCSNLIFFAIDVIAYFFCIFSHKIVLFDCL